MTQLFESLNRFQRYLAVSGVRFRAVCNFGIPHILDAAVSGAAPLNFILQLLPDVQKEQTLV